MENISAKIEKKTRKVYLSKSVIGNDGENLQEKFIFSFNDDFVDGTARLELNRNNTKSYIMLTKVDNTYELSIRSIITKVGKLDLQLVITEGTNENEIPIFKSNVFFVIVNPSINAEIEQPEEYPQWIDVANTKLNLIDDKIDDVEDAIEETNNLDLDVSKSGKVATVTLTKKDATIKTVTLSDGTSLMFNWDGTKLGIKTDEDADYTYVDLQGVQGPIGPKGEAFTIKKTYTSVAEMNADFNNMQLGDYVMIASTVEVEDNAKLYTRGEEQWIFISDFSGAQGIRGETGLTPNIQIGTVVSGTSPNVTRTGTNENPILNFTLVKGDKGDTGETGQTGATGNGIASITKTSTSGLVDTYTITYTDGTTSTFQVTNGADGEVTETELNVVRTDVDDLRRNQLMNTKTGTNINVDDAFDTRIIENVMTKESTQETTRGVQLFNKNTATIGGYLNENNGFVSNQSYGHSDYISVNEGNYYLSGFTHGAGYSPAYCYYDETKTFISGYRNSNFTSKLLEIPSDVKYIRFSFQVVDIDTIQCEQGTTGTAYEKFTGGIPSPNPNYPQEVITVKNNVEILITGKNLFDEVMEQGTFNTNDGSELSSTTRIRSINYTNVNSNTVYTLSGISNNIQVIIYEYINGTYNRVISSSWSTIPYTFTTDENINQIKVVIRFSNNSTITPSDVEKLQIELGSITSEYEPYKESKITIPLNDNEICGIGNYKDELLVDSKGHCYLYKVMNRYTFTGNENFSILTPTHDGYTRFRMQVRTEISSLVDLRNNNAFSNRFLLDDTDNNTVQNVIDWRNNRYVFINTNVATTTTDLSNYLSTNETYTIYPLATPQLIDLNTTVDIRLFNGINNISNSDNMDMTITYVQDINTIISNMKNAILEIGEE